MDRRIEKVLNYIEDNLALSPSLAELAAIACLSPSQFHRIFKKETGSTPFQFIEKIKMNKAYQLLIKEGVMVYELSESFGYNDYETFSRAFKKHFQISPDDLKAIAGKIKKSLQSTEIQKLIIATGNYPESGPELTKLLRKLLKEQSISDDELKNAVVFKITKKSSSNTIPENLIKNKFEIMYDTKIWRSLIKQR